MEQLLISLIQLAIDKKASDIHFIQEKNHLQIQLRTMRGIIPLYQDLWDTGFFEFLKFHAGFDLTNPYLPQSGQFEIKIQQRRIYCRFSVIVNQTIQTGVLRMLNTREDLSIEDLTDNPVHRKYMQRICQLRHGLVISTGPTNSGKTTTLHAILHTIAAQGQYKVVSLEDPIEIEDASYLQLQINEMQGFTYEKGIEELLRHDPDVIFIGETRNAYTAHMVVRAALTGHLVFTTMHSKNGQESLQHLYDFGIRPIELRNTLTAILSQRLYLKDRKGGKQCIYEILSDKALVYTIEKGKTPPKFHTLSYEIQNALDNGDIIDPQAFRDLQGLQTGDEAISSNDESWL